MAQLINEDVRHVVERELAPDETLLWAEKVDDSKRQAWVSEKLKKQKRSLLISIVSGLLFCWVIWTSVAGRAENTSAWHLFLGCVPFLISLLICFYVIWISFQNMRWPMRVAAMRPYLGYAVSTQRIFYVRENEAIDSLVAKKLMKVGILKEWKWFGNWREKCIVLSPVGTGLWQFSEFYFLPDFVDAKKNINWALKQRPPHE